MAGTLSIKLAQPISGTLSNVFLTRNKFGLNVIPPSIKFTQCQTVQRNALKNSPNEVIKDLWKLTNNHTNVQYDMYTIQRRKFSKISVLNKKTNSSPNWFAKFRFSPMRLISLFHSLTAFRLALNQNCLKTFLILPSATQAIVFLRKKISQNGE